jgi:hypothetical protein
MSKQLTPRIQRVLRDSFVDLELSKGQGMVRSGFSDMPGDEIVQSYAGQEYSWAVGKYLIRPCEPSEGYLPSEFRSALEIEGRTRIGTGFVEAPVALIQVGSLRDIALDQAKMLYLTRDYDDQGLLSHFRTEELEYFQMADLLRIVVKGIKTHRRDNIFLMDISPKDVRVRHSSGPQENRKYYPRLVETRSVEFGDNILGRKLKEKQIRKFGEAYEPFIAGSLLDWCLEQLEEDRTW